jgi:hypothetical protein
MFSWLWKRWIRRQVNLQASRAVSLSGVRSIRRRRGRKPQLESLEDRVTPALLFPSPPYPAESVASDGGGELRGNVPVYLIFAGTPTTGFGYNGTVTPAQITAAFQTMLASGYFNGLAQYEPDRAAPQPYLAGTAFNTSCLATSQYGEGDSFQIGSRLTIDPSGNGTCLAGSTAEKPGFFAC